MMKILIYFGLMIAVASAAPGYDFGFPGLHSPSVISAPVLPAPILPAPTYVKTISAPVFAPPILKTPLFAHAPLIKAVAPATSYASITQYVAHPAPIVKTVVAPQPILKSFAVAAPLPWHGYPALHH